MADDSKMADTSNNAEVTNNTTAAAASGIASDDHTYANIPPPAPGTTNADTPPTTAANATNSDTAPSSSSDNADGGASASEEPKPKVTNNVDYSFMLDLPVDDFLHITLIMSLFRNLLPSTFDENDLLYKVLTLIKDARTLAASSPPSTTTTTST